MFWLFQILIGLAFEVLGYLLMPKTATTTPAAATPLQEPTASAGRPIPVIFGTITLKSPNVVWFGDKAVNEYYISGD